jgi:hypothetical protein
MQRDLEAGGREGVSSFNQLVLVRSDCKAPLRVPQCSYDSEEQFWVSFTPAAANLRDFNPFFEVLF